MNNSEQLQILNMVENGQVSVEDAIGMMSAADSSEPSLEQGIGQRWLHVRVSNLETGKRKVAVNIPLGWMKWGLQVGSRFAPELQELDFEQLMTDLDAYADGQLVAVEDADDNQRVEIFVA